MSSVFVFSSGGCISFIRFSWRKMCAHLHLKIFFMAWMLKVQIYLLNLAPVVSQYIHLIFWIIGNNNWFGVSSNNRDWLHCTWIFNGFPPLYWKYLVWLQLSSHDINFNIDVVFILCWYGHHYITPGKKHKYPLWLFIEKIAS